MKFTAAQLSKIRILVANGEYEKMKAIKYLECAKRYHADLYYNKGEATLSDDEYDIYVIDTLNKLDPTNKVLNEVGAAINNHLSETVLPQSCGSLDNIKYGDGSIKKWLSKLPTAATLVLTQKLDGISILCEYVNGHLSRAFKRGNGKKGFDITLHVKEMPSVPKTIEGFDYTLVRGEAVMQESVFIKKYKKNKNRDGYKTSRNMVAGQFTHIVPDVSILQDIDLVTYEIKAPEMDKITQLKTLKSLGFLTAITATSPIFISEDSLKNLLLKQKQVSEYLMDGLVIDLNEVYARKLIGFETNSINPKYAKAFKMRTSEDEYDTIVNGIDWNVSKNGLLKPRVLFVNVNINGVDVSAATGKNARTIKDLGIGKGAFIKITRSGDAIPDILETLERVIPDIPAYCPSCNTELKWTETEADLYCPNEECVGRRDKRILSFFRTIEMEGLNTGTVDKCIEAGYASIDEILRMSKQNFESLDRVGSKNAKKLYTNLHKACKNVDLANLMHATGFFGRSLGSTKLGNVIEHFGEETLQLLTKTRSRVIAEIESLSGFAETSSRFMDGLDKFVPWYVVNKDFFTVNTKKESNSSNALEGITIVFTKFRDSELESIIKKNGGKIGSSVSKNTALVVTNDPSASSGKLKKARSLGIDITTKDGLINWLENRIK